MAARLWGGVVAMLRFGSGEARDAARWWLTWSGDWRRGWGHVSEANVVPSRLHTVEPLIDFAPALITGHPGSQLAASLGDNPYTFVCIINPRLKLGTGITYVAYSSAAQTRWHFQRPGCLSIKRRHDCPLFHRQETPLAGSDGDISNFVGHVHHLIAPSLLFIWLMLQDLAWSRGIFAWPPFGHDEFTRNLLVYSLAVRDNLPGAPANLLS